jgi:hypothetical protein
VAWHAVVDRAQLHVRRRKHGVVDSRAGAPVLVPAPAAPLIDAGSPATRGRSSPQLWRGRSTRARRSMLG